MKPQSLFLLLSAATLLYSCEPKPLSINMKQGAPLLTVTSATAEGGNLLVSASYSASTLQSLIDSSSGNIVIPKDLLLENGILTLSTAGKDSDTLSALSPGVYGRMGLKLTEGASYTLNVYSPEKGLVGMATTTYYSQPQVEVLQPELKRTGIDTSVYLNIGLGNTAPDDHYFISYSTSSSLRRRSSFNREDIFASLASFTTRQLVLLNGADIRDGKITKSVQLQAKPNDTLLVHVGKIDGAYYSYLSAYKKAGAFVNQFTGEPITLPSNVVKGVGYFSMSVPVRKIYYLKEH
jgi:hypothetical protein